MNIYFKLLLIAGLLTAGFKTGQHWESINTLQLQAEVAQQDAERAAITAGQQKAYRNEEARRAAAKQEIVNESQRKIDTARGDADRADRAAAGLHDQLAVYVADAKSRTAGNPGTEPAGAPGGDAIGVLAELFRRADERAGILARFADSASIAGNTCEREYDSLTAPK